VLHFLIFMLNVIKLCFVMLSVILNVKTMAIFVLTWFEGKVKSKLKQLGDKLSTISKLANHWLVLGLPWTSFRLANCLFLG
jgi:hypothetical protein